ncbi:hypothetical protein DRJ25_00550 [Candidatus Woesearchaeota archaeon]|nr:MAG: hypothetical protein DRJ25_00550 [Candidatus Woesearchaeota archaeon]
MANKTVKRRRRRAAKIKPRKKRPKTFKTEEAAKAYAEKHNIKDYKLVNIRKPGSSDKKIRIVI